MGTGFCARQPQFERSISLAQWLTVVFTAVYECLGSVYAQIRTEELSRDAAEMATGPAELMPPDLKDCIFEVTRKFQYTQKKMLINQLTTVGLVPEEVFAEVKEDGPDAEG